MSRNVSTPMIGEVTSDELWPAFLLIITFKSKTEYAWSGVGNLVYDGNTYLGVGRMASIGLISESTDVRSEGMTVGISGLDPDWFAECMGDIQIGAPASLYFATLDGDGNIVGTPYMQFGGTVDKSSFDIGPDALAITVSLENRLSDLQRASNRRYTSADQNMSHPDDSGFDWVEELNDEALVWG